MELFSIRIQRTFQLVSTPPATDLRVKDGSHSLDGPEHAKARPYRRPMRKRHRGDYP